MLLFFYCADDDNNNNAAIRLTPNAIPQFVQTFPCLIFLAFLA